MRCADPKADSMQMYTASAQRLAVATLSFLAHERLPSSEGQEDEEDKGGGQAVRDARQAAHEFIPWVLEDIRRALTPA